MTFVELEESSSRHLLGETVDDVDVVSGVPVVKGWVVAEGSRAEAAIAAGRRTDPEDPDASPGRRVKVQLVAPIFDPHVSLGNATLPLETGQLIHASIVRKKHYMSTTFQFHVHFADAQRLAFEARMTLRNNVIYITHAGHDRGSIRRRAGGTYHFNDENCQQVVRADVTSHNDEAPIDMTVAIGDKALRFNSRKAKWNHRLGTYVLDFQGLCDTASCKNMQLCPVEGKQTLANTRFIFGRQSDGTFQIYFRQPFTCLQAFVTALILFSGTSARNR